MVLRWRLAWLKAARLIAGTEPPLEEEQNWSCRGERKLTVATVGAAEERAAVLEVFVKGRSCWSWWCCGYCCCLSDRGEKWRRRERDDDETTVCDALMAAGGGYDGEKMSDDGVVDEGRRRRGKEKQRLFAGKRSNGCLLRLCVFFFLPFFSSRASGLPLLL